MYRRKKKIRADSEDFEEAIQHRAKHTAKVSEWQKQESIKLHMEGHQNPKGNCIKTGIVQNLPDTIQKITSLLNISALANQPKRFSD